MSPARVCPLSVSLSLFLSLVLVAPHFANAETGDERTLSPYFFVEGGDPGVDRLPLLDTSVEVHVSGVIADVTVRQTYQNDGTRPIHAKYVFPASTRAAVHGLIMTAGDHRITAKIKEREEAKKEYEKAKTSGKNAALLEQERPNVFTMNVANLMPGQRIDVELEYSELLVPTDGVYEFIYPTVVGPRYSSIPEAGAADSDQWIKSPYTPEGVPPSYTFELAGTVSAGLPIRDLMSPSHTIKAQWKDSSEVEIQLDPEDTAGGNRDFVLRYRLTGDALQSGLMLYEGADENFFLMMVQPPRRVETAQIPPREYIFIVDVSGSMQGFPLDTSKELLRGLIGGLRPIDTFNVLFFSGGSQLWAPWSQPAMPENIASAVAMLNQQGGGGGTELLAAVERAMALPREENVSRSLIIVTDGFIGAEKEVFSSIRENLDHANVFAFGIGSGVNRLLIEGIARAGMGEPFVVLNQQEAPKTAARFREYVKSPVLTGVQVAFDGFDAYDVEPASIPDVFAERPVVVHGKWRGTPRGNITVTGTGGEGPYRTTLAVSDFKSDAGNAALRILWARTRIADISDFGIAGETDAEKRQLVDLGLTYNLLTKHTSFIAVDEVIRNDLADGEDVTQPLPLPQGVSNSAVGSVAYGSEPGLLWLFLPVMAAGLMLAMRRRTSLAMYRQRIRRCA